MEKSYKSMLTLESLIWKVDEDLNRLLTYWIGLKCQKLHTICKRIDWKSMPHRDIMHFDTLFQM